MYYNNYLIHVNNNHMPAGSKQGGQFAPGDGDGDGITNDHAHRSKKFMEDMKSGKGVVLKTNYAEFKSKNGSYKRMDDAATTGIKAMIKTGDTDLELDDGWKKWFLFEDQTIGYAEIADLANQGFTKDEIKNIIKTAYDLELKNDEFFDKYVMENRPKDRTGRITIADIQAVPDVWEKQPYKNTFSLYEYYNTDIDDKYIEACVEAAKEIKHSMFEGGIMYYNNYLIHFNKNHAPKGSKQGGQFVSGDGDGDGIVNDHKNQKLTRKQRKERTPLDKKEYSARIRKLRSGTAENVTQYERVTMKKKASTEKAGAIVSGAGAVLLGAISAKLYADGEKEAAQYMAAQAAGAAVASGVLATQSSKDSKAAKKYDEKYGPIEYKE